MTNGNGQPEQVQVSAVDFTVRVTDLPDGRFSIQVYMPTGVTVLIADREILKGLGKIFTERATGIIVPES